MKTFLLTFVLFLFSLSFAFSQTVNNAPIEEIDSEYIQIVGTSKLMSNKVTIQIQFGQLDKFFQTDTEVKDENGKLVEFNSMIDALNFMSKQGYEFVDAYAITIGNSQNVYHFIMKKVK